MAANQNTSPAGATINYSKTSGDFRTPLSRRLLSLFGVVILAFTTAVMIGFAIASFQVSWWVGIFLLATAAFMMALTAYVLRDLRGNWGLHVSLGDTSVKLDLPSGRSLIHRPPTQHLTVLYADIAAIDTRLEAYGSMGMEIMQRSYALRRKSGDLIFLFEERGLATPFESAQFKDIVAELTKQAGVKLHDLGMVEGGGGFLATWGTHAPDWAAPSLALTRQRKLWQRAATTGVLEIITASAVTSAWFGGLLASYRRRSKSTPPPSGG